MFIRDRTKRRSYDTRIRNITNRYLKDYLSGQLSDSTFVILKKAFDKEQKGLETLTRNYILANTDKVTSIYLFLQNSFLFSPEEQRELIAHAALVSYTHLCLIYFNRSYIRPLPICFSRRNRRNAIRGVRPPLE